MRYIGFDMDDCVGHVHPLHSFTNEFMTRTDAAFVSRVADRFAACELSRRTGFIRPAMAPVLKAVYSAMTSGKIHGAFLFSNNDNHSLVLFVKQVLESMLKQLFNLPTSPNLFLMAISIQSPERGARTAIKDWKSVTACLKFHGLPLPTSRSDLLFFDDKTHVLTEEIPHYTVVPAYHHPVELEDFLQCVHTVSGSPPRWTSWMSSHVRTRVHTPDRVPTEDTDAFLKAIGAFLRGTKANRRNKTRKANKANKTIKAIKAIKTAALSRI